MLWAIDVGNTHTVFGLWRKEWVATFRLGTTGLGTEDDLASTLSQLCEIRSIPFEAERVAIASVAPQVNDNLARLCERWLNTPARFLQGPTDFGIDVLYEPSSAVGADRLANALSVRTLTTGTAIVVDLGTATTFDVIDSNGAYVGGAILPGPETLMDSLTTKTAKLPRVEVQMPARAIGRNTVEALQSGVVLGYVGALEKLIDQISSELEAPPLVVGTGGLGEKMSRLTTKIHRYEPLLTLDGIRLAASGSS